MIIIHRLDQWHHHNSIGGGGKQENQAPAPASQPASLSGEQKKKQRREKGAQRRGFSVDNGEGYSLAYAWRRFDDLKGARHTMGLQNL
ncbi:hypothetical protein PFLUV_G00051590 [Perca fluviatilis]|uniref:Uncharacterized protein n=1 Tax=Perca fluviatilis TaxID=8168 RepID=A0A6A5FQ11_PERFL|nr:hypothetical protein PFLUV_G00051590 [Perca fluviatilis]